MTTNTLAPNTAMCSGSMLHDQLRTARLKREAWFIDVAEQNAFDIWFQPIVGLGDQQVVAYEALARFRDGTSPVDAFQNGRSTRGRIALELAVVSEAIRVARALPGGVTLHLNVSPLAATASEMPSIIGLADRPVVLEITEHEVFSRDQARRVRAGLPVDCGLAADDVGAGYSGLAQLLEVRPDVVKIDRIVVSQIDQDPARQALVTGLVHFGEATGCSVIAEGVERVEERAALLALGVVLGQGYLLGTPVPAADHC